MSKLSDLDGEINPLIEFLKTISETIIILSPSNTKFFSQDNLRALKLGDRRVTMNLLEKGVPSRDVRQIVFNLSKLGDNQVDQIAILLGKGISPKELEVMINLLENIKYEKNKIQSYIDGSSYDKALSTSISIREKLRDLRTRYNLDTEKAEKAALDIQKIWGNGR